MFSRFNRAPILLFTLVVLSLGVGACDLLSTKDKSVSAERDNDEDDDDKKKKKKSDKKSKKNGDDDDDDDDDDDNKSKPVVVRTGPPALDKEFDFSGGWKVIGTAEDGENYTGEYKFRRSKETLFVDATGKTSLVNGGGVGLAIQGDDGMHMYYGFGDGKPGMDIGVIVYRVEKNGDLKGVFVGTDWNGIGTEDAKSNGSADQTGRYIMTGKMPPPVFDRYTMGVTIERQDGDRLTVNWSGQFVGVGMRRGDYIVACFTARTSRNFGVGEYVFGEGRAVGAVVTNKTKGVTTETLIRK